MMKKAAALMLAFVLTLGLTACGGTKKNDETEGKTAVDILQAVWDAHADDEKFPAFGGDMEHMAESAAGEVTLTDGEILDNTYGYPAESTDLIDECASIMHAMNQNTFTGAVYHVKEAGDVEDVSNALKENIMSRQWVCGFPEKLIIYSVGDSFIVAVFGNGEIVDTFETHLTETYESAKVLHTENLME